MGDARGIGPEVLLKSLASPKLAGRLDPVPVGVRSVLESAANSLWPSGDNIPPPVREALGRTVDISRESDFEGGRQSRAGDRVWLIKRPGLCGRWAGAAVEKAVELISAGDTRGMVTAPLDKSALNEGGYDFPGHTELLAHLAGARRVSMMLAGGNLRVVPATTHVALARVPSLVTVDLILGQCETIHRGLLDLFGIERPRIAVCGLNPHLGDGGVAGDEDTVTVAPAVIEAQERGMDVRGPLPADTVFVRAARGEFDTVLAMYHDQAMVAIKMHAFGRGVNITLGLPFVRTSPDHGTALDIAGRGLADEGSMVEAVDLAATLCAGMKSGRER